MTENPRGRPPRRTIASDPDAQPLKHPTRQAAVLLVGVTVLIVALAVVSAYGWL